MKIICMHCQKTLKVLPQKVGEISHGDCISYGKPCEGSKKYQSYVKQAISRLKEQNNEGARNDG